MEPRHEPVLLAETLQYLLTGPGLYLDATLGDGGHTRALLEAHGGVRVLGCDRDPASLAFCRSRLAPFGDRVMLAHATFSELPAVHARFGAEPLAGALFDYGLSSRQIDDPARGMSFMREGPLDLRMDPTSGSPLSSRLAAVEPEALAAVLREYGDVRGAGRLARHLVLEAGQGRLQTTRDLAASVARVLGDDRPATLAPVFQALRIWVNDEMEHLESALAWLPEVLTDGAVVVTLAYHSGEDRRVKRALRGTPRTDVRRRPASTDGPESPWEEITRKVVVASASEQESNPRARSARMRAFRRRTR